MEMVEAAEEIVPVGMLGKSVAAPVGEPLDVVEEGAEVVPVDQGRI